jgi:hypothetical protein
MRHFHEILISFELAKLFLHALIATSQSSQRHTIISTPEIFCSQRPAPFSPSSRTASLRRLLAPVLGAVCWRAAVWMLPISM